MQPDERQELIAQYKDGYRVVAEALVRATPEELDAKPAPGKWSARQIVHHLADSEMSAAVRFRLLIAEDRPAIKGYDQDRFADRLSLEHLLDDCELRLNRGRILAGFLDENTGWRRSKGEQAADAGDGAEQNADRAAGRDVRG